MRLIGIQALLTLLPTREEGIAQASGLGSSIIISNAGVVAHASGSGTANANGVMLSGLAQGTSHGTGSANAAGAFTGIGASIGAAQGAGLSSFVGTFLTASIGVGDAAGTGSASVTGFSLGIAAGVGSATGAGSSNVVGTRNTAGEFIARTSGLDSTHTTAYTDLIDGLIADGVWSKLDVLYIFATSSTGNALLNLISTSFTGTSHGSPSFAADRGYTGVDASSTVYIDSGFNPTTASSPHFVTNSCHVSAWCVTAVTAGSAAAGVLIGAGAGAGNQTALFARYNDGKAYFRINDGTASAGITNASSIGHWIADRTGSSASVAYKNGASFGTPNAASGTLQNNTINVLTYNNSGSGLASTGTGGQLAMASIGSGLTATDASNFYSRLRTYMTAVGVP
jgi:hypothetical protein